MFTNYLTLSPPIPLTLYTLPYWFNTLFLISNIRRSAAQNWAPERPNDKTLKNGGLDQYGAEALEQQQFGTAGVERVKCGPILRWLITTSAIFIEIMYNTAIFVNTSMRKLLSDFHKIV